MGSRTLLAACSTAVLALSALAPPVSAGEVIFDNLDSATSSAAFAGGIEPIISGTFNTGPSSVRVDVALLLRDPVPEYAQPGDTYTVSLDGGVPLSNLSFDPIGGLNYIDGSSVDFQGSVITSVTFPVSSLPTVWTVERYNQFAAVKLDPNSLYWLEVRINGGAVIEWGITADLSGPGVASNYLAWSDTDDGFFRNKGVDPFPFADALQMEVTAVPEPSIWAMLLLGFAGLSFAGYQAKGQHFS